MNFLSKDITFISIRLKKRQNRINYVLKFLLLKKNKRLINDF